MREPLEEKVKKTEKGNVHKNNLEEEENEKKKKM